MLSLKITLKYRYYRINLLSRLLARLNVSEEFKKYQPLFKY
jgi:hypothetical protein